MSKVDFLRECMTDPALVSGPVPHNEFMEHVCRRCDNKECSLSVANSLSFTKRATNWKKDLFLEVPRADDNDPLYAAIRQKNFALIDGSRTPEIHIPTFAPAGPTALTAPTRF